jgi:hypothetical protein
MLTKLSSFLLWVMICEITFTITDIYLFRKVIFKLYILKSLFLPLEIAYIFVPICISFIPPLSTVKSFLSSWKSALIFYNICAWEPRYRETKKLTSSKTQKNLQKHKARQDSNPSWEQQTTTTYSIKLHTDSHCHWLKR